MYIEKDHAEIVFLMNAVGKSLANDAVVGDRGVFQFYPREISIYFLREKKLTLFFAVGYRQIIKAVIDVHHFGDPVIGFLGDRAFGGTESDRFYKSAKDFLAWI